MEALAIETKNLPMLGVLDLERLKRILQVFTERIPGARKRCLFKLDVTTEELQECVRRGWLKCHKGKMPRRTGKDREFMGNRKSGEYNTPYKHPYELAGAKVTPDGRNMTVGMLRLRV